MDFDLMNATDIVAYTYQAEILCSRCTVDAVVGHNPDLPPAEQMDVEATLDMIAADAGIDRADECTFDSSEFPKVVFADQVVIEPDPEMDGLTDRGGVCMCCGEDLL
jgi:hypothetical protein